jgi:cell division septation protein DedD
LDEDTYIPIRVNERGNYQAQPEVSSVELSEAVVEVPQNTSTPSASGSQVIVGSFSSRTNADILVQSLRQKGFDAVILESGSTIRVSAGSGSAYNNLAPKLRAEGLEPWLLK